MGRERGGQDQWNIVKDNGTTKAVHSQTVGQWELWTKGITHNVSSALEQKNPIFCPMLDCRSISSFENQPAEFVASKHKQWKQIVWTQSFQKYEDKKLVEK